MLSIPWHISRFSSLLNIPIFNNTLTNQYCRSGKKQIQEVIQDYSFLILTTNTQELLLPHRKFSKPNYIFQLMARNNCHWSIQMDRHAQRGVHWANWSPQHTPNTDTQGGFWMVHSRYFPHLDSRGNTHPANVLGEKALKCLHLIAPGKKVKEKLWRSQTKTIK